MTSRPESRRLAIVLFLLALGWLPTGCDAPVPSEPRTDTGPKCVEIDGVIYCEDS